MGLLGKLLSPKGPIFRPGGTLLKAATSSGSSPSAPAPDPAAAVDPSASAGTYGDPNDPSYGSLTQPFDVEQFYNYADPGYSFELQQGQQALQNSAAAGSGALGGAALKDLLGYSQNFARTGYNDAFNRYQTQQGNIFQRLFSIAGLGENAAATTGAQGATAAGNAGANISNAGTASGSGIVGGSNSITNGATNAWLWSQFNNQKPVATPGTGGV